MDEEAVKRFLCTAYEEVQTTEVDGYTFFFHGPDHKFPFATLGTKDNDYDRVSNLDRPSVYRLNIGVRKETYRSLLGPQPPFPVAGAFVEGHDFTALDQLMPHPTYAAQSWLCVLNPSETTFQQQVRPLLDEAYEIAVRRNARKSPDESASTSE